MNTHNWQSSNRIACIPLRSRVIRAAYFQASENMLGIELRSGGWHIYRRIDAHTFHELVLHPHPGYFYQTVLRPQLPPAVLPWGLTGMLFRFRVRRARPGSGLLIASNTWPVEIGSEKRGGVDATEQASDPPGGRTNHADR